MAAASVAPPTTRSRKTSAVAPTSEAGPAASQTRSTARGNASASKPLWNSAKLNAPEGATGAGRPSSGSAPLAQHARAKPAAAAAAAAASRESSVHGAGRDSSAYVGQAAATEPIQSYLRLRPAPLNIAVPSSHVHIADETSIHMIPPATHRLNPSTTSSSLYAAASGPRSPLPPADAFSFTRVFPSPSAPAPDHSQAHFFTETTLPLVRDFLAGENCLLFAYGPTGSGKTWTVQGGEGENKGILPRVMEVVWESLKGKESGEARSSRFTGAEPSAARRPSRTPKLSTLVPFPSAGTAPAPPEAIAVEDGFEYSIWVSYSEVYNEKIYDLLQPPLPTPAPSNVSIASTSTGWGARAKGLFGFKGPLTVKRNALSLKSDKGAGQKYVAGMQELRVSSAEEASAILQRGQANRRVYGHLANRVSSRSHSIFTLKLVKTRVGSDPDEEGTASRFSIIDLAGSERVVNTGTTGERFKEACSINNSLMVLRQCMKVLRENQERDKGRKPAPVPFRHSKLTELFQSFFVGDGKAVLVVNVNPYETSFDENKEVMKFAAVANGVRTSKEVRVAPTPAKEPRVVRLSMVEGGDEEDIIYEEEDAEDEESDDAEDAFVGALLDELAEMRSALYEAQLHAAMVQAQARAATAAECEARLSEMEKFYEKRLKDQAAEAEFKLDAKLDILARRFAPKPSPSYSFDDSDEDDEVEDATEEVFVAETPGSIGTEPSPVVLAASRAHARSPSPTFDSPLPAPRIPAAMLTDRAAAPEPTFEDAETEDEVSAGTIEVPLQDAHEISVAHSEATTEDEADEDVFALDKSVVINKSKAKPRKMKRQLGGHQVKDAEAIETMAGAFSPLPKGISSKSSSMRSINSRA